MPYGVGNASYAKKIYGDDIEVKLFKYPDKLRKALTEEHCDILGALPTFGIQITHWACKVAKNKS